MPQKLFAIFIEEKGLLTLSSTDWRNRHKLIQEELVIYVKVAILCCHAYNLLQVF